MLVATTATCVGYVVSLNQALSGKVDHSKAKVLIRSVSRDGDARKSTIYGLILRSLLKQQNKIIYSI